MKLLSSPRFQGLFAASLPPLLPLIVALGLRLWQIDLAPFDSDQGRLLAGAAAFVDSGRIPQTSGLTFTIGVNHPPLVTFLLALPMLVSKDASWIAAFQASLDALGAIFLYLVGRDLGGRWTGLATGLLYAAWPAAILYGRLIWNPDLVPFFAAIGLWGAVGFALRGDSRHLAAGGLAICCAAQLHPSAASLLPVLGIVAIVRWRDIRWKPLALAAGALGLILAPYIWLQITTGWADLWAVGAYLGIPKHFAGEAFYLAASLIGGDLRRQLTSGSTQMDPSLFTEPLTWVSLALVTTGGMVALRKPGGWVALLWLLTPILLALRSAESVYPHYLLDVLPGAAALAGVALSTIRPLPIGVTILATIVATRSVDAFGFEQAVAARDVILPFGPALRYSEQAARLAVQLNPGKDLLVGRPDSRGDFFGYLTRNRFPIARFDSRNSVVLRPEGAFYIAEAEGHAVPFLTSAFGPPVATVSTPAGRPVFALFDVAPEAAAVALATLPPQPLDADIGHVARVIGYHDAGLRAGNPSNVELAWQVTATAFPRWLDLHLFGHLVDTDGRGWSTNPDINPFVVEDWRVGDSVHTWLDLDPRPDTPTGGYWLETGFYQLYVGDRPHVYDGARDIGTFLRLGPLKVSGVNAATAGATQATFGNQEISLVGVELRDQQVILTWHANRKPLRDYTVFVHALDAAGKLVGQNDSKPARDSYPTTLWDAGETIQDLHQLDGNLGSAIQLEIGLYSRPSLERLSVVDSQGRPIGDHLTTSIR